ncbi:anti-sigma factor [Phycicoccus flavus]|uniref:Regulator of SigK n=1 Tax=Phycicoccus flavus TaxID=2502783 RepID=A0A8T6R8X8_9MICO|nr:anti-sigma factor [Phycicoccus flavus]NHA69983.1 anti-sigma factor [Phycicoccus flavus]
MSPDLHHLSGAYSVDALDLDERTDFEHHLFVCASCQAEVRELSATAHALDSLVEHAPPASLRASVLAGIAQVRPLPPLVRDDVAEDAVAHHPGSTPPATPAPEVGPAPVGGEAGATTEGATVIPLFRRASTWLVAAAAAAVLAVGGVAWGPWSADQPTLTAVQQVEQAADATTVTQHTGQTMATLAYSRSRDQSALTVTGMPSLEQGEVYQLWYIGADGARSAGFLSAGADGNGSAVLEGSLTGADQVGVTVEPDGGSEQPTTQPVMVVKLA